MFYIVLRNVSYAVRGSLHKVLVFNNYHQESSLLQFCYENFPETLKVFIVKRPT